MPTRHFSQANQERNQRLAAERAFRTKKLRFHLRPTIRYVVTAASEDGYPEVIEILERRYPEGSADMVIDRIRAECRGLWDRLGHYPGYSCRFELVALDDANGERLTFSTVSTINAGIFQLLYRTPGTINFVTKALGGKCELEHIHPQSRNRAKSVWESCVKVYSDDENTPSKVLIGDRIQEF